MNSLTNAARTLVRSIVVAACVAALALAAAPRAGAEGYSPTAAGGAQASLCQAAGGTAKIDTGYYPDGIRWQTVTCVGGGLGGWTCHHFRDMSMCNDPPQSSEAADTDGVPPLKAADGLAAPTDAAAPIEAADGVAEEPLVEEPAVVEPAAEEPAVEEPVAEEPVVDGGADPAQDAPGGDVEGGAADEGAAEDGAEGDAGWAVPAEEAEDAAPLQDDGDPAADADQGAGGGEAVAAQDTAETDGLFFAEDDQQP